MFSKNRLRVPVPLLRNRMSWVTGIVVVSLACMGVLLLSTPHTASSTAGAPGISPVAGSTAPEVRSGPRSDYYPSQFAAPTGVPEEPTPTF
jgi:hypothetical protein